MNNKRKINPSDFTLVGCPSCNEEVPAHHMTNQNGHPVCKSCLAVCYTCKKTFISSLHVCISLDDGFIPEYCSEGCELIHTTKNTQINQTNTMQR